MSYTPSGSSAGISPDHPLPPTEKILLHYMAEDNRRANQHDRHQVVVLRGTHAGAKRRRRYSYRPLHLEVRYRQIGGKHGPIELDDAPPGNQ